VNERVLIATQDQNGWRVRLNGIKVVSFFGPHAHEWAVREQKALAELLATKDDTHTEARPFQTRR
jgi:hypothetical protein